MESNIMIEMRGITKHFGSVVANENVDLTVLRGEILSVLGENGSGKTSLMNMLAGIYFPDAGHIFVEGKEVVITSPKDAFDLGIGMIHQHFKLVDVLTAAENIILGLPGKLRLIIKGLHFHASKHAGIALAQNLQRLPGCLGLIMGIKTQPAQHIARAVIVEGRQKSTHQSGLHCDCQTKRSCSLSTLAQGCPARKMDHASALIYLFRII